MKKQKQDRLCLITVKFKVQKKHIHSLTCRYLLLNTFRFPCPFKTTIWYSPQTTFCLSCGEILKTSQTYKHCIYYLGMVSVISILKIDCSKCICWTLLCVVLHRPFSTISMWGSLANRPATVYFWVVSNQPSTATSHIKNKEIILYQTHLHATLGSSTE